MAKRAGDTRVSKWRSTGAPLSDDLYYSNGKRVEYRDLPTDKQQEVKNTAQRIVKALRKKIQGSTSEKEIDNGEKISVTFTRRGIEHIVNDALLNLSGKYFSENSMMRIKEIFDNAEYVKTPHLSTKERTDKRELWFSWKDRDGRGVYFKAARGSSGAYEIHSIVDVLKKQ